VPVGAFLQDMVGDFPVLSQVYNLGNVPLFTKAVLYASKVEVVGCEVVLVLSFLQAKMPKKMNPKIIFNYLYI